VECIQDSAKNMRFNEPEALLTYLRSALLEDATAHERHAPALDEDAPVASTPKAR
jgi:hypothetical protein